MSPPSILDYRQPVEFRISDVIAKTWTILSRHLLTFVLLVGLAELLPLVLTLMLTLYSTEIIEQSARKPEIMVGMGVAGVGLLQFILTTFAHAIVVLAAFQDLRGLPVSAAESLRLGLSRGFSAIVASVLTGLLVVVGAIFCLIPGLIALAAMAVVLPACVVERLGPVESMSRSADLTTGHRWPIAMVGAVWLIVVLTVTAMIRAAIPGEDSTASQLVTWAWQVFSGSFTAVYAAILYHDLRSIREGIGIDEIASVFD